MPNVFFSPKKFPFMFENIQIGVFTVDMDQEGRYNYYIDLQIPRNLNIVLPWALVDSNNRFIDRSMGHFHTDVVKNWVEERIFPPERHNAKELLASMGLSVYDQFSIIKYTRLRSRNDHFWVKFNANDSFKDSKNSPRR